MAKVLIVYATDHGGTGKMAEQIRQGVESVDGAEALVKTAGEATYEDLLAADALILGTPVHMGSMDWRVKKFIDEQCSPGWMKDTLVGKVGAVFASGSGFGNTGAGAELAMLSMLNNLVELGMIIMPLPKNTEGYQDSGLHWGAYARAHNPDISPIQGGIPAERLVAAKRHGIHVAKAAIALSGHKIFG